MHPVLFTVGNYPISSYGVLFLAGILVAVWLARRNARFLGLSPEKATDLTFVGLIGGLAGAKLLYVLILLAQPRPVPISLWDAFRSGGVFFGGLIGLLGGTAIFVRIQKLSWWDYLDCIMPGTIIAHGIGRIGCFLSGCCYGAPTGSPLSVTFTDPFCARTFGTPLGQPLHPVQLYEAGAELLLGGAMLILVRRRTFVGQIVPAWLIFYGPVRFTLEFLRSDFRGQWLGGVLSTSQILAVVAFVGAAVVWVLRRGIRPPPVGSAAPVPSRKTAAQSSPRRR